VLPSTTSHYAGAFVELQQNQREWEDLAEIDPMWAILSNPGKRGGGWQDEEFNESGRAEIARVMQQAAALGLPDKRDAALDFGCGVGRLTRPLARHFGRCVGVDISERMITTARAHSTHIANLEFMVNVSQKLSAIADDSIDFIYSRIVLQHVSSRAAIRSYLAEFARVLAPGGLLIFQLPSHIPVRHRLQPRPRLYSLLRRLGVSGTFLYHRLRLQPIRMRWMAQAAVETHLSSQGLTVMRSETEHINTIDSTTYYATRAG
jgi:ubiquinone/menaquinone biosynthesis C-methylase UbiE